MDLFALRQTASHLLAASVFELYPSIDLWTTEATDSGFVSEFYFPHPINPETLSLIEGQMKQIVREARPIRSLEMVPLSAFELLKDEGHIDQCQILEETDEDLVELIEIGNFHQLSRGPLLKNTVELGAFKLLSLEPLPDRGVRITGVAAHSKGELKEFLKKLAAYKEMDYRTIGQNFGFWRSFEDGLIWTERGMEARLKVQNLFFQDVPLVDFSGESEKLLGHLWKDSRRVLSGSTKDLHTSFYSVQKTTFCPHAEILERITSCLHSNYKILIMLGFDCWVRISGKRRDWKDLHIDEGIRVERVEGAEPSIDLMVEDPILRPWEIASLKKLKLSTENPVAFVCEAFVERIMVLLLEKNLGIPLFLERART